MVDLSGLQEKLSGLWGTLNDKCWPLLDALRLSDLFEKYNIPPIVFPLAIILLLLLLLTMMAGGPRAICGDGLCALSENVTTCAQDCQPSPPEVSGADVTVRLDKLPGCEITVTLVQSQGSPLEQSARKRAFIFTGVQASSATVEISDYSGHSQSSEPYTISGDAVTIELVLSGDLCKTATERQPGTLSLTAKDAATNSYLNGVGITISETRNGQVIGNVVTAQPIDGQYSFTLPSDKPYRIFAQKTGYNSAQEDVPAMSPGQTITRAISLTASKGGLAGDLEVCVKNGTQPMTRGMITIQEVAGNFLQTGQIEEADQTKEPSPGCYIFTEIPAGKVLSASMPNPPAGCVPAAGRPSTVPILAGQSARIDINVTCPPGGAGYIRFRVIGKEGEMLTADAAITLWTAESKLIPGNGPLGSLSKGSSGYTEEVSVPAGTSVYAWVRDLPSGYLDVRSGNYTVSAGQHKSVTIYLNESGAEPGVGPAAGRGGFAFRGVSYPNIVGASRAFTATIAEIDYNEVALIPPNVTLRATFAGSPCSVSYNSKWTISCTAPQTPGNRSLILRAAYKGKSGAQSMQIRVIEYLSGMGLLVITPLFGTQGEPPFDVFYEITFNGQPVTTLTDQAVTIKFADSPDAYTGEAGRLALEEGYWKLVADVPYKGAYEASIFVEVMKNSSFYNASYTSGFSATKHSRDLGPTIYLSKRIFEPSDDLAMDIILTFKNKVAYGLSILKVFAGETFYTAQWDNARKRYHVSMKVPAAEICADKLQFLINGLEFAGPETISIIDLNKTMSPVCPLGRQAQCSSLEDIRRCLSDKKSGTAPYDDEKMLNCIRNSCRVSGAIACTGTDKGDLVLDCKLDGSDAEVAEQWLSVVRSSTGRSALAGCLDMDNDGDVDEDDLTCLKNVGSSKWYGDKGAGTMVTGACAPAMKGGFCFDIATNSRIPGDLVADGNIKQSDVDIMQKIIRAIGTGVTPHANMLKVADFNLDRRINNVDLDCLRRFMAIDFQKAEVVPSEGASGKIPIECLRILGLACTGAKGDLNDDDKIDALDMVLIKLLRYGMIDMSENLKTCADVNSDGSVTEDDVECMSYYLSGDMEQWMYCLDCEGTLPPAALSEREICHDGYDNNCDGKTDDEDGDCACTPTTPCHMKWDLDGGASPGIKDGNYLVCRDVSWDSEQEKWMPPGELTCMIDEHPCETQSCNSIVKICTSEGGEEGEWYEFGEWKCKGGSCSLMVNGAPTATSTSAVDGQKTELPADVCEDGWDNDCYGGDAQCPEGEDGNFFKRIWSIDEDIVKGRWSDAGNKLKNLF